MLKILLAVVDPDNAFQLIDVLQAAISSNKVAMGILSGLLFALWLVRGFVAEKFPAVSAALAKPAVAWGIAVGLPVLAAATGALFDGVGITVALILSTFVAALGTKRVLSAMSAAR